MPESRRRRQSGNPAKRAQAPRSTVRPRMPRDAINVDTDLRKGLVVVDLRGEVTGLTPETAEQMAQSLVNAAAHVRATR